MLKFRGGLHPGDDDSRLVDSNLPRSLVNTVKIPCLASGAFWLVFGAE